VGPVVSIGGAGTFDGVYLTGLASVLLLLFLSYLVLVNIKH
jgi:hypothetical protein